MKKHLLASAAIIATLCLSSCKMNVLRGSGNKTTTTPTVTAFNGIEIEIPVKAEITVKEGAPAVTISGYANILKHIKTYVDQNKLHVEYDLDDTWTVHANDMTITINTPSLNTLTLSGAPDANVHGLITGSDFRLQISGASDVDIDSLNTDNLTADVSGAADIKINGGKVNRATYSLSGAGDIKAFRLETQETSAAISGAGDGQVTALQKLTASISGAGEIKYKGHPTITKNISGMGEVTDAN